MYHATFCIKYEDSGSPEKSSGTTLFYLYDKNYAHECVVSLFLLAPGSTSRPGGLAAFYYVPPPTVGQVVYWHLQLLLSEAMLPFVLSTKTLGLPRRARGLPSFIYMISVVPISMYSFISAWHRVRPVGPEARCLLLYAASCSRTSNVLAPKTSPVRSRLAERLNGGQGLQNSAPHEKRLRKKRI